MYHPSSQNARYFSPSHSSAAIRFRCSSCAVRVGTCEARPLCQQQPFLRQMDYATPAPADADAPVLVARLSHIRGMLGVLQTVKQTKKQARLASFALARTPWLQS